jgi:hypothetical protein
MTIRPDAPGIGQQKDRYTLSITASVTDQANEAQLSLMENL